MYDFILEGKVGREGVFVREGEGERDRDEREEGREIRRLASRGSAGGRGREEKEDGREEKGG